MKRNSIEFNRKKKGTDCLREGNMRISLSGMRSAFPFSRLVRQLEQEMETVVKVLQPGPLGIVEHNFSAVEMRQANAIVRTAVDNWRRNANLEKRSSVLRDFIQK
ncbi:hypothetical protein H0E87_024750 [Populus deltoides]|nr:hypothetical protein H0E87_024750 [Populus deltoides]